MATLFEAIKEDFHSEIEAIRLLVSTFSTPGQPPKARIAASNSATLLIAATFEEFVRQCAKEYARAVVTSSESFSKLPPKLAATAWKRSMESLARVRFDGDQSSRNSLFIDTHTRFSIIHEFVKGDINQDIYDQLVHNENNMRPSELNSMFKLSGLSDVCSKMSNKHSIMEYFGEAEPRIVNNKIIDYLEEFMERRNSIAHSLNPGSSAGPDQIIKDLDMFKSFSISLCAALEEGLPKKTDSRIFRPNVASDAAVVVVDSHSGKYQAPEVVAEAVPAPPPS